jgi:hypothetical protein
MRIELFQHGAGPHHTYVRLKSSPWKYTSTNVFLINLIAEIYCTTGFGELWGLDCCKYNRVIYTEMLELWARNKAHVGMVAEAAGHKNRELLELCK